MKFDIKTLQAKLCSSMCAEISLHVKNESLIMVDTPFTFPDGDPFQIYVREVPGGVMRLTDMGHTLMHLSYDIDIDLLREGNRSRLLTQIMAETPLKEYEGEFFIDTNIENIGTDIFRLSQALIKIYDLSFLSRSRVESTFYEDLKEQIINIAGEEKVIENYVCPDIENSNDYPIDFMIPGKLDPLFLFGVPNKDKTRLTTIILERLLRSNVNFESLIVFSDQESIPKNDLARLTNVGGEMIASLDAYESLERKIRKRIA